jgi:NAD(P)-dependent dehydrogenase (short-subunit alcohol dehydrogenase family)
MMMKRLEGKKAVILGAATGDNMAQRIARRFADEGAAVLVSGRNEAVLKALSSELGGSYALCDITDHEQVSQLAAQARQELGTVDVAVNAAGWGLLKPTLELTDEELEGIVNLQFKGVHYFLAEFVRTMMANPSPGGSLINISSATTKALVNNHAAYIGTKAGGEALVRCVANDYGQYGIRANSISPAFTKTPMTKGSFALPGLVDVFQSRVPLGRLNTSDDVAAAALWLASDEAFVTGENMQVNGGLTLRGNPQATDIESAIMAAGSA